MNRTQNNCFDENLNLFVSLTHSLNPFQDDFSKQKRTLKTVIFSQPHAPSIHPFYSNYYGTEIVIWRK